MTAVLIPGIKGDLALASSSDEDDYVMITEDIEEGEYPELTDSESG